MLTQLFPQTRKLLVISRDALDCKPYNTNYTEITWETCSLRKWLNGEFLNVAFTSDEKGLIHTVSVHADKNQKYVIDPGNSTQDKVFLLSIAEIDKYFSSINKSCKPSKFTIARGAYTNEANGNCRWGLRTPGEYKDYTTYVGEHGNVGDSGLPVYYDNYAVRPGLWIDLN